MIIILILSSIVDKLDSRNLGANGDQEGDDNDNSPSNAKVRFNFDTKKSIGNLTISNLDKADNHYGGG